MNICIKDRLFFVLDAEQQFNKLLVWRIVYSECQTADCVSMCNEKFSENFALCVINKYSALSPRRIKDKFSLVFSKFSPIALVARRLGQFCENFENTRENLSLILLGLMRLHIQIFQKTFVSLISKISALISCSLIGKILILTLFLRRFIKFLRAVSHAEKRAPVSDWQLH